MGSKSGWRKEKMEMLGKQRSENRFGFGRGIDSKLRVKRPSASMVNGKRFRLLPKTLVASHELLINFLDKVIDLQGFLIAFNRFV